MKHASILIVDDDNDVLDALGVLLEDDFSRVVKERYVNRLPSLLEQSFDIVLLDMNFSAGINSGNEGLYWLAKTKEISPTTDVVMMTAYGNINLAVEAIKRGAKDFVLKPWSNEKMLATLSSLLTSRKVNEVVTSGRPILQPLYNEWKSAAMRSLLEQVRKVASTDASVLILGENGTGKEVFARQIHELSGRAKQGFLSVDLSAIPENLFESELFGHRRGAFTDAKEDRTGKFLAATGGTLFLDEIGNLPLPQQVKILTVLQNRVVTPVGSLDKFPLDVRLISATNSDLSTMVSAGRFRQDLLYRINTITLTIPPLRERLDDFPFMAEHFLKEMKVVYNKPKISFDPEALITMKAYDWPGNVRELRHTIEKAVILCDGDTIFEKDLALSISGNTRPLAKTLDEIEKEAMISALKAHKGNVVHAAKSLGVTRQTLYNKMKKYGI